MLVIAQLLKEGLDTYTAVASQACSITLMRRPVPAKTTRFLKIEEVVLLFWAQKPLFNGSNCIVFEGMFHYSHEQEKHMLLRALKYLVAAQCLNVKPVPTVVEVRPHSHN